MVSKVGSGESWAPSSAGSGPGRPVAGWVPDWAAAVQAEVWGVSSARSSADVVEPKGRRLTEDDARWLFLVRAVEIEDRGEALLTREDRQQANAAARDQQDSGGSGQRLEGQFLARRGRFAAARLTTRHPSVDKTLRYSRWPSWIGWAVPIAALVLGLITNEIGSGKRLNIVAFPLIGMFAWNLTVYLSIVVTQVARPISRGRGRRVSPGPGWLDRLRSLGQAKLSGQDVLSRALVRFLADWSAASRPITGFRSTRTLHLGSALFAAGLIGGMYLRALGIEYRAGWESTFLDAAAVHGLVSTLLGLASALTNIPLPDVSRIAAIRWEGPIGGGENAGRWIHLYAATAAIFVIIPRLALAATNQARILHLSRRFPVPGREDFYLRRLLRGAQGLTTQVRVTSYAFTPGSQPKQRLVDLLEGVFGENVSVQFDAPAEYGSEDRWLKDTAFSPAIDHHIVLFNLASTPELENHGAFAGGLRKRLSDEKTGTAIALLLDEASYRERLGPGAGTSERLNARRAAWQQALSPAAPLVVDLSKQTEDDATVSRLEAGLLHDAALEQDR